MLREKGKGKRVLRKYRSHIISGVFLVLAVLAFLFFYGAYVYYMKLN